MKNLLLTLTVVCMGGAVFAQTQSISLRDNGLYGGTNTSGSFNSMDTFTLSTNLTFDYTSKGFSYWLEVPTALAPYITIASESYFTFTFPNSGGTPPGYTFTDTGAAGQSGNNDSDYAATEGGLNGNGDLGATQSGGDVNAGSYHVSDLVFSLTGAPAGTYTLQTTLSSVVTDTSFNDNALAQTQYTITVVPEPSTWFAGIGAVGVIGYTVLRQRQRA